MVKIRSQPSSTKWLRRSSISAKSSGTTSIETTSQPASSASAASAGPDSSSASRRETDVETVRTAVRRGQAVAAGVWVRWAAAMRSRTAASSPARSSSIGSGSPLTMPSKKTLRSW